MKYILMIPGTQQDYDAMASGAQPGLTAQDMAGIDEFLRAFNQELEESGEFVDAQGLAAPVHTRRVELREGVPVVTDGPYAETQEVLAGYWIVDCASFDRATEIAAKLGSGPGPQRPIDVRPVAGSEPEL
ncbi:YciI family protein [Amycolatopsis aidingensis]|uniref:YciI family protein n=1 Tax=Amycolatopsis aidingensis TaxID=2842453 RepID=UPI001C0D5EDD|nr:YciI family protein [Amycolatopsis aidingensis]